MAGSPSSPPTPPGSGKQHKAGGSRNASPHPGRCSSTVWKRNAARHQMFWQWVAWCRCGRHGGRHKNTSLWKCSPERFCSTGKPKNRLNKVMVAWWGKQAGRWQQWCRQGAAWQAVGRWGGAPPNCPSPPPGQVAGGGGRCSAPAVHGACLPAHGKEQFLPAEKQPQENKTAHQCPPPGVVWAGGKANAAVLLGWVCCLTTVTSHQAMSYNNNNGINLQVR